MPTTTGFATDLITFSRGSLATVTDSNGYIKWAPHNLLLASEQFDASSWLKTVFTVSANTSVAPNGTTTADTLNEGTANSFRALDGAVTTISGANYTVGIFLKYVDARYINITLFNNSTGSLYSAVCFDVQNGAVASSNAAGTGYAIVGTPSITSVGNNWYYCSFVATVGSTTANYVGISTNNTNTFSNYGYPATFTGTSRTVYLWGAHLYRSDLGGMQANASAYPYYNPSTPKNLLGYSEAFDNAAWAKSALLAFGSGSVVNAIAAPNGSLSADLIVPDTTSAAHLLFQNSTVGGLNVQSAYVKPAGYTKVAMRESQTGAYFASFDLVGSGSVLTASSATASITALNDGWYRIAIIGTISGTTRWSLYILDPSYTSGGVTGSWTANGTSGLYLWGAQLSDSASLDPYVGSYGAAPSPAAAYGPRLDYDPSTLAAKGLLVEEQRTNLAVRSNEFSNASWTKTNISVAQDVAGPDAATSAFTATAATNSGLMYQSVSVTAGTSYTFSFFAKRGTMTDAKYSIYNETASSEFITPTSYYSSINASTWSRVTITFTVPAGCSTIRIYPLRDSGVTGTTLLYGAQLEAGAFATSYIPTAAATVTRNADVAFVATSQFPYSATEGTLVVNYSIASAMPTTALPRAVSLNDGSTANVADIFVNGFFPRTGVFIRSGASNQMDEVLGSNLTFPVTEKVALALKVNDAAATKNGLTVVLDTTVTVPAAATQLQIGNSPESRLLNGHIRQITYIPRRLTNAELISRTA